MIHLKLHNREAEELLRDLDRRKDELLDGLLFQLAEKLRKALPPKRDSESYAVNLNGVPVKFTRDRPGPMRPLKGSYNIRERRRRQKERAGKRAAGSALPYPKMVGQREKALKKATKRERRASVRETVFERAKENGYPRCEGPLDQDPFSRARCMNEATELLHAFGRGKGRLPESERTCLAACGACHRAETRNHPSGAAWWGYFSAFFRRLGFAFEANEAAKRAHFESIRAESPAAPRIHRGGE